MGKIIVCAAAMAMFLGFAVRSFADWLPENNIDSDKYLKEERKRIENSLKELDSRGIAIVPTPKEVKFQNRPVKIEKQKAAESLEIVNACKDGLPAKILCEKLKKCGLEKVKIIPLSKWKSDKKISVLLAPPGSPELIKRVSKKCVPEVTQGYIIDSSDNKGKRAYILSGIGKEGMLYACVTFAKLLKNKNDSVEFPFVKITDWPDVLKRCVGGLEWAFRRRFMWDKSKNTEEGKRYVDWALDHKINMLCGVAINDPYSVIGFPCFRTPAMRKWLREINDYAWARGIRVILPQTFAVGVSKFDKDKPEFKECIDHRGGLFDWSCDELMKKKINELNKFIKETNHKGVYFHSIDTTNARWHDRGAKTRQRFGDDRMKADANLINIFYNGIKKENPDTFIVFIPRPYIGNLENPVDLIKKGELKSKDDMSRFSKMLPDDVYLCKRESNKFENQTWKKIIKQPLFIYISNSWAKIPLNGRIFSPMFRYSRSIFEPLGKDALFYCSGWPEKDVSNIGAIEYSWNLNAPGSADYNILDCYSPYTRPNETLLDVWDTFGPQKDKNKELSKFIERTCDDLYGKKYGKYFYKTCIAFLDWNLIFDTKTILSDLKEKKVPASLKKQAEWLGRSYNDSNAAIADLKEIVKTKGIPEYTSEAAGYFLSRLYLIRAGSHALSLARRAEIASKKKDFKTAMKLMKESIESYDSEYKKLEKIWPELQKFPSFRPVQEFKKAALKLEKLKSILELTSVKIQSRMEMNSNKPLAKTESPKKKSNSIIKVALYDPSDGKVYGAKGLLTLLNANSDIKATKINDLSLNNLKNYDCLVFPDCKSFGSTKVKINDLRSYVIKCGGGIYFEHDSCGFMRFPLQTSIFPEVAEAEKQVGVHPKSKGYKAEEKKLKIALVHDATVGNLAGTAFEQIYYDHFQLKKGDSGTVLIEDIYGKPVLICGEVGKGRVIFYGGLTFESSDKEVEKAFYSPESEIIINGIHWLAGKTGTEIIAEKIKKEDKVLPDGTYSIITFKPKIIPAGKLRNAKLTAKCYNAKTLRPISGEVELCVLGNISKTWEAEDEVSVKADEYPEIKLVLSLMSEEGSKTKSMILK